MPIKFILQAPYEKGKDGKTKTRGANKVPASRETTIYAFMIIDGDRVIKCKTDQRIIPTQWDFKKQGLNEQVTGAIEYNLKLAKIKKVLQDEYDRLRLEFPDFTFQQLSERLKEYSKLKDKPVFSELSLFDALDTFIAVMPGTVAPGTIKKYVTLKRSLEAFCKHDNYKKKYKHLSFSMINHTFFDNYMKYLREQEPRGRQFRRHEGHQKGLLFDTVKKYIENLKSFCKWAEKHGHNKYTYYKEFAVVISKNKAGEAKKKNNIITLSLEELTKFYYHDFSKRPALERVRDLFCFATFTGQRWGDFTQFNKSQLRGDVWAFKSQKTGKDTEIDLTGFAGPALQIAEKYNYKLPQMSLPKFNEALKDAAKEAGIDTPASQTRYVGSEPITTTEPKWYFLASHAGRRTCVSILLNNYGMAPSLVMEITGHSDLKTLQKYLNEDRSARREAMGRTKAVAQMQVTHRKEAI